MLFVLLLIVLSVSMGVFVSAAPVLNEWLNPSENNSIINGLVNVTVNVTDNVGISSVLINFDGTNFSMSQDNDLWYYLWNTSEYPDGLYNITIFSNNTLDELSSDTLFNILVNNINEAPIITSTPVTGATAGIKYTYDVNAEDPDKDTLTFELIEKPSDMTINNETGLISWTASKSQIGINNVTVSVTDRNIIVNQSFQINVVESPKLRIKRVDVKVDGKTDKNLKNGDKIGEEAKPGSKVDFEVEVENLFTREEDLEINDILVEITIEEIDDGDDLEEEAKEFDLKQGKDDKVEISFDIPLDVDEDTYNVIIRAEGDDENETNHEATFELQLEVEKETHEIRIMRADLTPSTIKCQRDISINTEIINTGSEDEDDVTLKIINNDLSINSLATNIELEEGTEDNKFTKVVTQSISDNTRSGIYPITVNAYFDGELSESETVDLTVEKCVPAQEISEEEKEGPEVEVVIPESGKKEGPESAAGISFFGTEEYTVLLIILAVIFAGLAIFIVGAAFKVLKK